MYSTLDRDCEPPLPEPLGYLITWTTYGTWLPGDKRGWVAKRRGVQPPDARRANRARLRMRSTVVTLDNEQRSLVEATIAAHCNIRKWELHVANARTNHVHVVVTANRDPEIVRRQFQAWCTRRLKELEVKRRVLRPREDWWTEGGSERRLNDRESFDGAIIYARDAQ